MEEETTLEQGEIQEQEVNEEQTQTEGEVAEQTGEEAQVTPAEKTVPLKALEEERRKRQEAEARLQETQNRPSPEQQKTIYDYYEENPKSVVDYLNGEIARLSQEDPYSNAGQIEALRDQKIELRSWANDRKREKEDRFNSGLTEAIPEYHKQKDDLKKFALEQLGYTANEFNVLVNPAVIGESTAIKNLKLIKRQYDATNAGGTVRNKEVRKQPNPVESSTGKVEKTNTTVKQLKEQALKSGSLDDWAAVLEAGG